MKDGGWRTEDRGQRKPTETVLLQGDDVAGVL